MATVYLATTNTHCKAAAVAETADAAARLACSAAMEHLQAVYPDFSHDDPMMVGKHFGVAVTEFEVGTTAILQHRHCALAS